ncbi:transcriptional regulator [Halarchaeum salinum]|uniref:Transcriptional regulator n=1 Tax=Halarchaeum salinum TaxID=489912 RepID=A0AAV3S412_9EURY
MPTLKVTVGERETLDEQTRNRLKAAQAGEDLEDVQPTLNFESYAELSRLLSTTNLELLEAIATHHPESISEAAELVDRDYKQVHTNLNELADLGVIEFESEGAGHPKTPTLAYDGIEIDIPFADSSNTVGADAP